MSSKAKPEDAGAVSISADGRFAAFDSFSDHLVDGDTNGAVDVLVRDRLTRTTVRASVSSDGQQGEHGILRDLSPDGRFVLFSSSLSSLVPPRLSATREFAGSS